jgi:hypothetical protein
MFRGLPVGAAVKRVGAFGGICVRVGELLRGVIELVVRVGTRMTVTVD